MAPVAFVSYAREDQPFVQTLIGALEPRWEIAWDQDRDKPIRPGTQWWDEIEAAIRRSGKFIFVVSPESLRSDICRDELHSALSLGKQVLPILRRPVGPRVVWPDDDPELGLIFDIQWIRFDDDAAFEASLRELIAAIDNDLDSYEDHAWLLDRTAERNRPRSDRGTLLRGRDLKRARAFIVKSAKHGTIRPLPEQREYVAASRRRRREWLAALVVIVVIASSLGTVVAVRLGHVSGQATANMIANQADQLAATDPSLAAQLDVAANAADATPDSKTRLLATSTEPLSAKLTGPASSVNAVAYSPDGKILAAGADDGKVWLWDLADPAHPSSLGSLPTGPAGPTDEVQGVAFSPDGTILAASSGDAVWRWRFADPAHPARPAGLMPLRTGSTRQLDPVAFSGDGHTLVAADAGSIWRWDVTDQAQPVRLGGPLTGPAKDINAIAMSPVGDVLAAASGDGRVWRWNLADPANPARLGSLTGLDGGAYSVAFSRDGRYLAAGSYTGQVSRWNVASPAHPVQLGTLSGPGPIVVSVAFSPDGTRLAATSRNDKVWLWNLANPADAVPFGSSPDVFGPDGQDLATGSADGTIRLWNLPASVLAGPDGAVNSMAFGPRGKILAASDTTGTIWLWDRADPGRPGQALTGPTGSVDSVALSPDGRILAATSAQVHPSEAKVWLWNVSDPGRPVALPPVILPDEVAESLAFSPDSKTLAVGGEGTTGEVWLWNLADPGHPVRGAALPVPVFVVESVAFSQARNILAAGGGGGAILLWNVADPAHPVRLDRKPLHGAVSNVSSVAISPDGRMLAAASGTGVGLWNLADAGDPALVTTLSGPTKSVSKVAFGQGGKMLAAGSWDANVWLWSLADPGRPAPLGQPLSTQPDMVEAMAFSPDGTTLAAGGQNGATRVWDLDVDAAIQRICATTSGALTAQQWSQYFHEPFPAPCAHLGRYGLLTP